jgi:hypothetical protein
MQPDTEHQQNHTNFRKLRRDFDITDEPGRIRPNRHAGDEVSDNWGKPEAFGEQPEDKGGAQANGNGSDERDFVH